MSPAALYLLAVAAIVAHAQPDPTEPTPLYSKHYDYDEIPYQVDYNPAALRGPQVGYNICNSTTENQNSMCQTSFVNHIDDFCLWGPSKPGSTISDTEGQVVAWCTKPGHGTRLIPDGALKGVQYIKTPNYIQVVGFIDQTLINLAGGDLGGELDPHGADLRGNPIGGLMYSNAFPTNDGNNKTYQQVSDWTNFIGNNAFCFKVCDPDGQNQGRLCQNIYDRLGCTYNVPNRARNGTFEVCRGADMSPPGIYTSDGQIMTWFQPSGTIAQASYSPALPSSSNCTTYHSTDLYRSLPTGRAAISTPSPSGAPGRPVGSRPGSAQAPGTTTSGASTVGISFAAAIAGVAFGMTLLS